MALLVEAAQICVDWCFAKDGNSTGEKQLPI